LDEDIFVGRGFFQALFDGFQHVEREGRYNVGFVAPVLNVNGITYVDFLEELGQLHSYEAQFGRAKIACAGVPVHRDPEAAKFLWNCALPFDEVAARFAQRPFSYYGATSRFSIGAILFRRSLWEAIGGFRASVLQGGLGADEAHLCMECCNRFQSMIMLRHVFAGHFGYGPQRPGMLAWFHSSPGFRAALAPQQPGKAEWAPQSSKMVSGA
jgi:hypothetical protein